MAVYVGLGLDISLEASPSYVTRGAYGAMRQWLRGPYSAGFALPHELSLETPIGWQRPERIFTWDF